MAFALALLTPLTTDAGEWLEHQVGRSEAVHKHTELGDTMIFFVAGLVLVALLLLGLQYAERSGRELPKITPITVMILAAVIGIATMVQTYRIGDSGAQASWGDFQTSNSTGG